MGTLNPPLILGDPWTSDPIDAAGSLCSPPLVTLFQKGAGTNFSTQFATNYTLGDTNFTVMHLFPADLLEGPGSYTIVVQYGIVFLDACIPNTQTFSVNVVAPCVAYNTKILLENNQIKNIQDIKRGDKVYADLTKNTVYTVAKVHVTPVHPDCAMDFTEFLPNSLADGSPNEKLITTAGHPILYKEKRYRANSFVIFPSVIISKMAGKQILPADPNGKYFLYDLQFETTGSYVANNVVVQSRSPKSFWTPLPKELYFNVDLYSEERYNDYNDPGHLYPLEINMFPSIGKHEIYLNHLNYHLNHIHSIF
jgi:hypothetical protein